MSFKVYEFFFSLKFMSLEFKVADNLKLINS